MRGATFKKQTLLFPLPFSATFLLDRSVHFPLSLSPLSSNKTLKVDFAAYLWSILTAGKHSTPSCSEWSTNVPEPSHSGCCVNNLARYLLFTHEPSKGLDGTAEPPLGDGGVWTSPAAASSPRFSGFSQHPSSTKPNRTLAKTQGLEFEASCSKSTSFGEVPGVLWVSLC